MIDWHDVLREHRDRSDCGFSLSVCFGDPPTDDLVRIREHYDYYAQRDDPGAEYSYTVLVARGELGELVGLLAAKAGQIDLPADPEEALLTCLRTLVATGQLPTAGLKAAHTTVQRWLDEAGIAHTTKSWAWINSD